jgi:rhombotail lipoprotein
MRVWKAMSVGLLALTASACGVLEQAICDPHCHSESGNSSSLVEFLYPNKSNPPLQDAVPQLRLPLRVGLAFLPARGAAPLDEAHQQQLLERIRQRFSTRPFVSDIVLIPDYYLANQRGFQGLEGVQHLYGVDLMALVSYDQALHESNTRWSLGYLTIAGAFVLNGDRHDISTLVDLAVVDPASRSLVLRAGGTDVRHGTSTLVNEETASREAQIASFSAATDQMIGHFDVALDQFQSDVRAGKANVRVVHKSNVAGGSGGGSGGGGALGWSWIALLLPLALVRVAGRRGEIAGANAHESIVWHRYVVPSKTCWLQGPVVRHSNRISANRPARPSRARRTSHPSSGTGWCRVVTARWRRVS